MRISCMLAAACGTGLFVNVNAAASPDRFLRPADSSGPPYSSTSQHYVFRGLDVENQARLARSFEEFEVRIEGLIGIHVPYNRSEFIAVNGLSAPPEGEGSVDLGFVYLGDVLHQKIFLMNPESLTEDEVVERLILLLLNRYVLAVQGAREGQVTPFQVPVWLSEGLAQNLRGSWREQNARFVTGQWKAGQSRSVRSVFQLAEVDQIRSDERAYCGVAMEWLLDGRMDALSWGRLFARMAEGGVMDPEGFREGILGFQEIREMEKNWDVWLAGKTLVRRDLGTVQAGHMLALQNLLALSPRDMGLTPGTDTPPDVRPADLLARRDQPWMRPYATRLIVELDTLASGTAPEFRKVTDLYKAYYEALAKSAGNRGGLFAGSSTGAALRGMLEEADSARTRLERELTLRGAYLEDVQATVDGRERPVGDGSPDLQRERRNFLDNVQDRLAP